MLEVKECWKIKSCKKAIDTGCKGCDDFSLRPKRSDNFVYMCNFSDSSECCEFEICSMYDKCFPLDAVGEK